MLLKRESMGGMLVCCVVCVSVPCMKRPEESIGMPFLTTLYCLEIGPLAAEESHCFCWPDWPADSPPTLEFQAPMATYACCVCSGDSNSGPCTCPVSILTH